MAGHADLLKEVDAFRDLYIGQFSCDGEGILLVIEDHSTEKKPVNLSNAPRVALIDAKSVTSFEMNVDMVLSHYIEEFAEPVEPGLGVVVHVAHRRRKQPIGTQQVVLRLLHRVSFSLREGLRRGLRVHRPCGRALRARLSA